MEAFAIAAPGLEPLVTAELRALGLDAVAEPGGARFSASVGDVQRANLWSRTASRIVVRVARFRARALGELERRAGAVPWEEWLGEGAAIQLRVTAKKSRLYHTGAIAERVLEGVTQRIRADLAAESDEEREGERAMLLVVRVMQDSCTISLDSSGALLHRRGYRQATAKAPVRETLAAGLLAASGWAPDEPITDPMCGSGTIAIEAAMMARGMAPGLQRRFAFEQWPSHDAAAWQAMREAAVRAAGPARGAIRASDRDEGAVQAARENAARAGVTDDIEFQVAPVSGAAIAEGGWIVTNPPYGLRVGESARLRDLYATLGRLTRDCGATLVMLSADRELERQLRLRVTPLLDTRNGGIPVRVVRAASV